jgi:hypothetical protein
MHGLHSGFSQLRLQDVMLCAWEVNVCVPTSETYAEVRKLSVKVQGAVGWYVTVYPNVSQYLAEYTSIPDAWSAHSFFHL